MDIEEIARKIRPLDEGAMTRAKRRQDNLTKPKGSLGRLEDLSIHLAGIYRTDSPRIRRKVIFTMAADHGVTAEGVSAYPSEVTAQMVSNFACGGAAISILGRHVGARIITVDMGVAGNRNWPESVISCKIRCGTGNMAREEAMTTDEAKMAIQRGIELSLDMINEDINLIGIGDMGIGNTTAASALTAVFTDSPIDEVTGRGTGVDDESLRRKIRTIETAFQLHRPDATDPLGVLSKLGGLEIAGMTGVILGAANRNIPVILDGFISGSSALVATAIAPQSREYMIASHLSVENGHSAILRALDLEPLLDFRMRLGEGTGSALAMPIVEAACKILNEMATFEEAGVSRKDE